MSDNLSAIRNEVKNMHPHIEKKDVKQRVIKEVVPTSLEAKQRAENARKNAHRLSADVKRNISMELKNKLSESFEFIEESCGSGAPEFEFYKEPQMVTEGLEDGCPSYPIIGRASGVFAPIGVMSRNNRKYDEDHYDYLLENQQLVDRITHRGMLGTIGHHDKKVDDQDLAEGKVSHIVTNLKIVEEADGSRNLYGVLEILDTPAGHLLKTYYDSGIPLFVSSRGGGNLLPVPNESYKRVDKTKYFLETFDIVKNPGFLQAKPVYEKVSESVDTPSEEEYAVVMESKTEKTSSDKIDALAEAMTKFINYITESKKEEQAEKNEKKEVAETKEAKEKKEAKEAKEVGIEEAKKESKKEEDKPEDEKNDDEESAVASSVTEGLSAKTQKAVDKMMDPHVGMTKADIANGYEQQKIVSPEQAQQMGQAQDEYNKQRKEMAKLLLPKKKPVAQPLDKKEVATQLKLGLREDVHSAIDDKVKDKEKNQHLHAKAFANQSMERQAAVDRVAGNDSDKYHKELDELIARRHNKNTYEDTKRILKKGSKSDSDRIYDKIKKRVLNAKESVEEQPIAQVQASGDSVKSAQETETKVKEPVAFDYAMLARAIKDKKEKENN